MILFTGAAGYIGSHTVLNFLDKGFTDIVIFDNLETGHIETIQTLQNICGNVKFEKGDLRNISDIEQVFQKYKINFVIHFAAFAFVEESMKNPSKYYRNNILGTLNLLDTMVKYGVKKIIFSSTCATYGEPKYTPIDENHPQSPINPYGFTKLAAEKMMDSFDTAFGLKSIKLRYFNAEGADKQKRTGEQHMPETHLIPNILKAALNNETFKMYGDDYNTPDGTCIRDYINVEDLAEAHRLAYIYLEKENKSNVFNLGTNNGYSIKEVIQACQEITGQQINVHIEQRRQGDPAELYSDSNKAKEILGWYPKNSLKDSIKTAFEYEKLQQSRKISMN